MDAATESTHTTAEESAVAASEGRETAPGFAVGTVVLKPRKARPFYGRHPWVLDTAIDHVSAGVQDGDVVDLVADNGKFVARGIYNHRSKIRVRLYTWNVVQPLDESNWRRRIERAIDLRRQLGYEPPASDKQSVGRESATRLVYSEADGLSGLIVDRFGDWLSVQVTGLGMAQRLPQIAPLLMELTRARGMLIRTEKGTPQAEGIELRDGLYCGELPGGPVFIEENGLRYGVDLAEGQKTGFYLDQRENRKVAAGYFRSRRVLDMFCYSGGFSLNASRNGHCASVTGFDSSAKAIALAKANAGLNEINNAHFEQRDCFEALEYVAGRDQFGAVILDPPKFARSRSSVEDALRAYHRLNRLAVNVLEPGGILVTCSCSGHVSREDFIYMLVGVSQQTHRDIQILEQRGASADHPIASTCLENEYLKCFICRVV